MAWSSCSSNIICRARGVGGAVVVVVVDRY